MVIPTILSLKNFLEEALNPGPGVEEDHYSGIKTMVEEMLSAMNSRFTEVLHSRLFVIVTFLDPRFKITCQDSTINLELIKLYLLENHSQHVESQPASSSGSAEIPSHPPSSSSRNNKRSSLLHYMNKLKKTPNDDSRRNSLAYSSSDEQRLKKEIEIYANLDTLGYEDSPDEWWCKNTVNFPLLHVLARSYLAIPPSSVESERIFSTSADIYCQKRNRLLPENADMLLFIKKNLQILREEEDTAIIVE